MKDASIFGFILGLGIIFIIFGAVIVLALYILTAYPLYMILKSAGYDLAWLAWIPFCQYFAIVMAFNYKDDPNISLFGISVPRPLAGFAGLIASVLSFIPIVGKVLPVLAMVVNGLILAEMFDVCEDSDPGKNTGMGILCAIIAIIQIPMFFKFMKKATDGGIDVKGYQTRHPA